MDRPGHQNTEFFVGTEVEHSPAWGQRTLFVVGVQPIDRILDNAFSRDCEHIYLGANQSFEPTMAFEDMLMCVLANDIRCTLDFDVQHVQWVLETGATEDYNFIPMISVKLPNIQQLGYNATLKLDDIDFRATNPGVWCHKVHDIKTRHSFTDWSQYTKDEVIK